MVTVVFVKVCCTCTNLYSSSGSLQGNSGNDGPPGPPGERVRTLFTLVIISLFPNYYVLIMDCFYFF